eukprot:2208070-Lingulodinium_polyedra.AAC.1
MHKQQHNNAQQYTTTYNNTRIPVHTTTIQNNAQCAAMRNNAQQYATIHNNTRPRATIYDNT